MPVEAHANLKNFEPSTYEQLATRDEAVTKMC
jgi:hypothetical protein